jgi:hypothetical protein
MIELFALAVFALGYGAGRWHGVIHERDLLRDLADQAAARRQA